MQFTRCMWLQHTYNYNTIQHTTPKAGPVLWPLCEK